MTASEKKTLLQRRLGLEIRRRRDSANISQEKLAEFVDCHRNYMGRVERGEQNLTVETLNRVAVAFKCRPSDLLRGAGF